MGISKLGTALALSLPLTFTVMASMGVGAVTTVPSSLTSAPSSAKLGTLTPAPPFWVVTFTVSAKVASVSAAAFKVAS